MQVADIPRVIKIENRVFPTPWPAHAYKEELTRNKLSHCTVLEAAEELLGYGCFWLMYDEAHISTLAVAPTHRGRGLGELLVQALIYQTLAVDAAMVTLEVRVSNMVAQSLYAKYGMQTVGRRKRYYVDNHEDALIMTVAPLDDAFRQKLDQLRDNLFAKLATG